MLVKRGDHDLHIYGTGERRRAIVCWHSGRHGDAAEPEKSATGGTAAEL